VNPSRATGTASKRGNDRFSLEGWKIVAGGRSVAHTTGQNEPSTAPWRGPLRCYHPFRVCRKMNVLSFSVHPPCSLCLCGRHFLSNKSTTEAQISQRSHRAFRLFRQQSGGLRCAPTTGYFLSTLQAGTHRYREVVL